jgi:multiple sugar transport system substrate-binding protein
MGKGEGMKRSYLLTFISVFLLTFHFTANAKIDPVKLIYYLWEDPANRILVYNFNHSQNEILIDAQFIQPEEYEAKLTTLMIAGTEIDVFMMRRQYDSFSYFSNGYMYPLDDMIKNSGEKIESVDNYRDRIMVDGKIIGIPFRGAGWYTYYNKKIFEKAGVKTPEQYVSEGIWTWDKFMEVSRKISSGNGKIYGSFIYLWGASQVIPCNQIGMQFITNEGKIDVNEGVFLKSFRMRKMLEQDKALFPLFEMKNTKTHYSSAFFDGNIGMLLMGEWFPNNMRSGREEKNLKNFDWNDWSVTRLPCDTPTYASFGNPTYNSIHPNSLKKDAAFKYITWMGSKTGSEMVAKVGVLPSIVTPEVKMIFTRLIPDKNGIDRFFEEKKVYPQLLNKYGSKIEVVLSGLMDNYLSKNMSDKELVDMLKQKLIEIINTSE